jgi:hypothetical protein
MRQFPRSLRTLALGAGSLLIAFTLTNCGKSPSAPGSGTLSVYAGFQNTFVGAAPAGTVAPLSEGGGMWGDRTPLSDLIVNFNSIQAYSCSDTSGNEPADDDTTMDNNDASHLQPLSDGEGDGEHDMDGDCQPFTVLADSSVTLSAAGLDTTLTKLLGQAALPAGQYDYLVLGMAKAWVVTQAGDTVEAKVPSGQIKVNSKITVTDGGVTDVLITFDVNRSVVEAPPGSMNFIVKPVFHCDAGWSHDHHEGHD